MKKMLAIILAVTTVFGNSLTAFAAPETMPDGTIFDAEYYAANNPDVVSVLGTNLNALYQHYITYGKNEGRLSCAPDDMTKIVGINGHGEIVSSYEDNYKRIFYTYEDGYKIMKSYTQKPYNSVFVEDKYIIPRIDFCDGLLDLDNNGIDDRDPYNSCGYTDLNYNCIADGVPTEEGMVNEAEAQVGARGICEHGVVGGYRLCQQKECVEFSDFLESVEIE